MIIKYVSLHPSFWWTSCRTICPEGVESHVMGPSILGPPEGPGAPGGTILLPRGLREPGVRYRTSKTCCYSNYSLGPGGEAFWKCDQKIIAPVTELFWAQDSDSGSNDLCVSVSWEPSVIVTSNPSPWIRISQTRRLKLGLHKCLCVSGNKKWLWSQI